MKMVYLSLGSNVGDRARQLQRAVDLLAASDVKICRISPVYETEPWGHRDQKWFFNIVVETQTLLFPLQFLGRIQKIEDQLKRQRTIPNGPRTIDIDILFFGDTVMKTAELEIPHPRYAERRFVLTPIVDLVPELRDPATEQSMSELLADVKDQEIKATNKNIHVPRRGE